MTVDEVIHTCDEIRDLRPSGKVAQRALEYCEGMKRTYRVYGVGGVVLQVKTILQYLRHWRGEKAKEYRALLKLALEEGITLE